MDIFNPQAKLLYHGKRVSYWLDTGSSMPILIEIAPSGKCNASCPWCFFRKKNKPKFINKEVMLQAIDDLTELGLKAINWSGGGEPTLHPDFNEFISYAAKKGLKQGIFSNGYQEIPQQDKFEWIRLSLTDKGIKRIIKPKVPFGICVNHIYSYTVRDLDALCLQAKQVGAAYFQVRPALVESNITQPVILPPNHLKNHTDKNFQVYITEYKYREAREPKNYKNCYGYHFVPSIDWNGRLSVCLYLTNNPEYVLGDLNKKRIINIWPDIKQEYKVIPECQRCCKNHEINKILYAVKNIKNVDFI